MAKIDFVRPFRQAMSLLIKLQRIVAMEINHNLDFSATRRDASAIRGRATILERNNASSRISSAKKPGVDARRLAPMILSRRTLLSDWSHADALVPIAARGGLTLAATQRGCSREDRLKPNSMKRI
jgi:hypothetical protein